MGRMLVAALAALVCAVAAAPRAGGQPHWLAGDGYDFWADCSEIPEPFEFLPIYQAGEVQGYVDLGRPVLRGGVQWRALQYSRDKDLGPTRVTSGVWYGGMGADEWPPNTVDVARQTALFRVTSFEVDGNRHAVDPSCAVTVFTEDVAIGLYNAWVRFNEPGLHTLKITGRQIGDFFFIYPFAQLGSSDPFGLEGRRVLLRGESIGDLLDGDIVHAYELHVGRD